MRKAHTNNLPKMIYEHDAGDGTVYRIYRLGISFWCRQVLIGGADRVVMDGRLHRIPEPALGVIWI